MIVRENVVLKLRLSRPHNAISVPHKTLHKLYFQFLLGLKIVPRE